MLLQACREQAGQQADTADFPVNKAQYTINCCSEKDEECQVDKAGEEITSIGECRPEMEILDQGDRALSHQGPDDRTHRAESRDQKEIGGQVDGSTGKHRTQHLELPKRAPIPQASETR